MTGFAVAPAGGCVEDGWVASVVGEFTVQRQRDGRGHFGHARVEVTCPAAGTDPVVWSVPAGDPHSVQPKHDDELVDAAFAGVRRGLELVREMGGDVPWDCTVAIVGAWMRLTDINASAVRAASAMAVADAFGVVDRFRLEFGTGWRVALA